MKIAIVIGTRPEIIKMASVIDEIIKREIDYVLIHTGQHYDEEMSNQFFLELDLPEPQYNIGVGSASHAKQTAIMMEGIEEILINEKVDILLVQGDTNAVLAGAIVASKLNIPIGHVEAGLRSFDKTMPEEINRLMADVCTKMYFVPTEESGLNLISEGTYYKNIYVTGNTVVDACIRNLRIAEKKSNIISKLNLDKNARILAVTIHRAENVDNEKRLNNIVDALLGLNDFEIVFPVHPRTKKMLNEFDLYSKLEEKDNIHLIKPIGYLDFLLLLSKSFLVLTDSGGIQEEAITLNVPAMTLRYNTERPETVSAGGNILVGSDKDKILATSEKLLNDEETLNSMKSAKNPYGFGNASEIIIESILNLDELNKLSIESPEDIMDDFSREMKLVKQDTNVEEIESKENIKIKAIYNEGKIEFPKTNLSLKNKHVIYDRYIN